MKDILLSLVETAVGGCIAFLQMLASLTFCMLYQCNNETRQSKEWMENGVCVNHEHHNGNDRLCGVRALARRYFHIQGNTSVGTTSLSTYFVNGKKYSVTQQDISEAVILAATACDYPATRGTPISLINTHSLCIGRACALALAGYLDTQIQSKMGRWRGATFKEGRLQSWLGQVRTLYEPVPYHQAKKQQPKSTTKNTTIMTSHPIILH